jgi:peptidoglycan/xylan/chitin deacetylase (PgdA/CDA1 family)
MTLETGPGVLILMYHRVAEPPTDPWSLSVSPRHLEEHLQVIQRLARPVTSRELAHSLRHGWKGRLAVLTFDDGYSDNYYQGLPLLERHDVPATFLLATGFLDSNREFWWDELDRVLLQPGSLPPVLRLDFESGPREWELGESAVYEPAAFEQFRSWSANDPPPSSRHQVFRSVWLALQRGSSAERTKLLKQILDWAQVAPQARLGNRPMTSDEAAKLAHCRLVEIAAHTVSHPALSTLSFDCQHQEIVNSRKRAEEIAGGPVASFSYPFGDYNADSLAILRQSEFTNACSTSPGAVHSAADPLRLPRFHVSDWGGDELERRMRQWFEQ